MMTYALDAGREVLQPTLNASDPRQTLVAAKCLGLLCGYDSRWHDAPYRIDAVECVLTSDLFNPETGRKSRSFSMAGKLDIRATEITTGRKVIIDHKTASADIADPSGTYWRQLAIEGQVSQYMLLEWLNGNKVDGAVWDVIRKPGISPKELLKGVRSVVLETREYFGVPLSDDDHASVYADGRETPAMYAARLAYDCTHERPDWYFQRRTVPRLDSEIREYGIELWGHAQDVLAARQSGRWPRNSGACMTYGSPCKFLALCSGHDTLDSGAWTTKQWVHNELPVIGENGGRDVLTNSRIRCFQTCRRKHQLQYEFGVEKFDEEEKESLFFGSLFHAALERYFIALQHEQKGAISCLPHP